MGQISNIRRIIVEDYEKDMQPTIERLSNTLNNFMEEVVNLSRGNIDYVNLDRTKIVLDVSVDANSKPINLSQIQTGLSSFSGSIIINVQGVNSSTDVVISTPYLDCTYQGNGLVKINRIFGLPTAKKMRVTIEFIG